MSTVSKEAILDFVENSYEAMTPGEVLAELTFLPPYFVSQAVNTVLRKESTYKINNFFDNKEYEAIKLTEIFCKELAPTIYKMEKNGELISRRIGKKVRFPHTFIVSDNIEKIEERISHEAKKKKDILPKLMPIAQELSDMILERYDDRNVDVFAVGSVSENNPKSFIHYPEDDKINAVSNMQLVFSGCNLKLKDMSFLEEHLRKIMKEKQLPITLTRNTKTMDDYIALANSSILLSEKN
ncbi:MAG: hypothetical protein JW700_00835 [Candidatus Aenigmarchaeota archaeon]|nr:hypothetical protein [Candidatus Aenigmarchaeota archaeon]